MRRNPSCAVQYLRMSTDEQELSLEVQRAAIAKYSYDKGYRLPTRTRTKAEVA